MRKSRPVGIAGPLTMLFICGVIVPAAIFSTSKDATQLSMTKARVEETGYLVIAAGKETHTISRDGDDVKVDVIFPIRRRLCGPGCTVKVPFGLFYELSVTENEDRSITVEWPFWFWMR